MRGKVNRILLAVIGLVLLLLGGSVLAVGLGAPAPSWWIHDSRHDVLLDDAERTHWRDDAWWWPVVLAVLAIVVVLALWWLISVLRRRRLAEILVDSGDGAGALLRGRALQSVVKAEAGALDGVAKAHVHLTGGRTAPRTRIRLLLEPHVNPSAALDRLTAEALTHAKDSAALDSLPAEVRMKSVKHRAERVS
ncbi:alkaline shock response membrane anchor protein AmaP [Streptomyces sp. NPDC058739]|uniref:alkaline shock response membrane anchor protein AmaP n=1 Tax=Streptomyces sp. NPDC058739 TaxID=3346618 RepID=UPI0036944582